MFRRHIAILMMLLSVGFCSGLEPGLASAAEVERGIPAGIPNRPQGMRALTMHPQAAHPFSRQDISTYFATHNLPRNLRRADEFVVDKLEFLTSKKVSQRLRGVSTGLHDNELVGFATLVGTFAIPGPPGSRPVTYSRGYAAFDAATGNLLMFGTLPEENTQR